jgi:hypothetical protein
MPPRAGHKRQPASRKLRSERQPSLAGRHVDVEAWTHNHKVEVVDKDVVDKLNAALKRGGVKPE